MLEQLLTGPLGTVFAGAWGAIWGSFFNVVVVRVPAGESVVKPPSYCRACGRVVRWYDNVPVLSYVALRGRCRSCGARYSMRYALVEALVSALAVAVHHVYVVQSSGPLGLRVAQFVIISLFSGLLVAVALIDLDTMRIPNAITYPGIPTAVVLSLFMGHENNWEGALGAVVGYTLIRLIADGYEWLTGRQGMGYGDAKLLALIGGLLGWKALLPTLFLAALQGSLIGIGALVWFRRQAARSARMGGGAPPDAHQEASAVEDTVTDGPGELAPLRHARIPFGPFLSLAALELLLLPDALAIIFPYAF